MKAKEKNKGKDNKVRSTNTSSTPKPRSIKSHPSFYTLWSKFTRCCSLWQDCAALLWVKIAQGTWHFWKFLKWRGTAPKVGWRDLWILGNAEEGAWKILKTWQTSNRGLWKESEGATWHLCKCDEVMWDLSREKEDISSDNSGRTSVSHTSFMRRKVQKKRPDPCVKGVKSAATFSLNTGMVRRKGSINLRVPFSESTRQQCIILSMRTSSHVELCDSFTFCSGLARILRAPSHAHLSP